VVLAVFTVLGIVFMPALVYAMASGFAGDERFDLAVEYGRLAFPYILFISLTALVSGVLNATGRFLAAAAAPVLLNVVFIAAMLVGAALGRPLSDAMGTAIDEALGLRVGDALALVRAARRHRAARARLVGGLPRGLPPPPPPPPPHAGTQAPRHHRGPAALAGGVVQVNLLIGRQVASFFDGAVAWLSYADRLYQLPLGVVGIAIGVVLLPALSRRLRAGDTEGGRTRCPARPRSRSPSPCPPPSRSPSSRSRSSRSCSSAAPSTPTTSRPPRSPSPSTARGCRPSSSRRSTSPSSSRARTRAPLHLRPRALVVNAAVAIGLAPVIGLHRRRPRHHDRGLGHGLAPLARRPRHGRGRAPRRPLPRPHPPHPRRLGVMGAVLWVAAVLLGPGLGTPTVRYAALAALVAIGMATYALAGRALGAFTMADLRGAVRR
jgi:putative peptidoglycan lipid II flippase